MNFAPYLVAWAVIAAATITLLIYRAVVGAHEDESLHVAGGGARLVAEQQAMFKKLGVIERWTKIFLILTVVCLASIIFPYQRQLELPINTITFGFLLLVALVFLSACASVFPVLAGFCLFVGRARSEALRRP